MIGSQLMNASVMVAFTVGLVLLWLGWRGRRLDDHPWCRKCKFDLYGRWPAATVCPECGSVLNRRRAVRIGQRRKRPIILFASAIILVPLFWPATHDTWQIISESPWIRIAPEWCVIQRMKSNDVSTSLEAVDELGRRALKHRLSNDGVRQAMDYFGSNARPSPPWAYFLTHAWDQIENDRKALIWSKVNYVLVTRPTTNEGDDCVIGLQCANSNYSYPMPKIVATCLEMSIDGKAQLPPDGEICCIQNLCEPVLAPISARPGSHTLKMRLRFQAFDGRADGNAIAEREVSLSTQLIVVPSGTPAVTLLGSPSPPPEIRIERIYARREGNRIFASRNFYASSAQPYLFDVYLRTGGNEWFAGHFTDRSDWSLGEAAPNLEGFQAQSVDIVLRPNPILAAKNLYLTQIWGEEIAIPNVPVVWEDAAASQPATSPHAN